MFLMNSSSFRNWEVLCWNVRGLNYEARQRDVTGRLRRDNALFYVSKKLNAPILTFEQSASFVLGGLTVLLSLLLLAIWGYFGTLPSSHDS